MKLAVLNGPDANLPITKPITKYSNFDAGFILLSQMIKQNPNLTWGDLNRAGGMGWSLGPLSPGKAWRKTKNLVSDVGSGTRKILNYTGDAIGKTVRLGTDEKVFDAVMRASQAMTTKGGSELQRMQLQQQMKASPEGQGIAVLGANFKKSFGEINPMYLMGAVGGIILLALLTTKR